MDATQFLTARSLQVQVGIALVTTLPVNNVDVSFFLLLNLQQKFIRACTEIYFFADRWKRSVGLNPLGAPKPKVSSTIIAFASVLSETIIISFFEPR